MRETKQRDAVRQALADQGRPLSIDEILKLAQKEVAGLGVATVYRNLKALQLAGQIRPVDLPGLPPRWEMTQLGHHHHFLCRGCDRLFEIEACPDGLKSLLPKGYTLEDHDILLQGRCETCAQEVH